MNLSTNGPKAQYFAKCAAKLGRPLCLKEKIVLDRTWFASGGESFLDTEFLVLIGLGNVAQILDEYRVAKP